MTRIEKSDSQLDAEAEARRRKLDSPTPEHGMDDPDALDPPEFKPTPPPKGPIDRTFLRLLIIDLRRAIYLETPGRLHAQHTSKTGDELDARGWPADPDEGGLGLPFSAPLHRYLRTNEGPNKQGWDRGPDPRTRPAYASIVNESERCHARHTSHLRPGYSLSLCAEMMSQVARLGLEPEDLAWHFDLPLEQVESMLLDALRHAREWREGETQRLTREPGHVAPLPERRRVA